MPIESLLSFFGGLLTKAAPHLLAPHEAVLAENCVLDTGRITPLRASALAATVATGTASIFLFNGTWLTHTSERWYTQSDFEGALRCYYADGGIPQKRNTAGDQVRLGIEAPTGGSVSASSANVHGDILESMDLAITFFSDPLLAGGWGGESAPLLVNVNAGGTLAAITIDTHSGGSVGVSDSEIKLSGDPTIAGFMGGGGYVITSGPFGQREIFRYSGVKYDGTDYYFTGCQRGQLGTAARSIGPSTALYAYGTASHSLSAIPVSADPQVNARRIYRLSGGEYKLVAQIDNNTDTNLPDTPMQDGDLLGASIMVSTAYDPPPNLTGICGPYNGMLIGWLNRTLYGTKVGKPDAWQELFTFSTEIAATATFGGYVVVLCQDAPYTVSGFDPDGMARHKSLSTQGCVYGRTAVDAGRGLAYLSPDGICVFDGASSRLISDPKLKKSTFSTMTNPKGAFHDGHYLLFFDSNEDYPTGGCLIGDLRGAEPIWQTATETARSVFRSDADDALYLGMADGSSISEWEAGDDLPWRYWTGELAFGSLMAEKLLYNATLDCSGDVQIEVWIDGQRRHLKLVESPTRPYRMRMAGSCRGRKIQLRFSGPASNPGTVNSVEFDHSGPRRAR